MTSQDRMFNAPQQISRPAKNGTIEVFHSELHRSIKDCHRLEDAIWRELAARGCDEQSKALQIDAALMQIPCPAWCEQAAWDRIAESYRTWSTIFGNLQLFWQLRRKRDE